MRTTIIISAVILFALMLMYGCNAGNSSGLRLTVEPVDKTAEGISYKLADAGIILEKRFINFGIPAENIEMDIKDDLINIMVKRIDTAFIPVIENLLTLQGKIGFWETYENGEVLEYLGNANKKLAEMKESLNDESSRSDDSTARAFSKENPLFSVLAPRVDASGEPLPSCLIGFVKISDTSKVSNILKMDEIAILFPRDLKFIWSKNPYEYDDSKSLYELHAIKQTTYDGEPPLGGDVIALAKSVESRSGDARINLSMTSEGARIWARMTRENINRCIAVVIDGFVRSYPRVMAEIPGGNTEIAGDFSPAEAKFLSCIFGSGANGLPLKLKITEKELIRE
jgi:SecD/SecF fusion protein